MREYFLWLAKVITFIVLFCVGIPLILCITVGLSHKLQKGEVGAFDNKHQVAVVELTGVIESSKDTLQALYEQADNKDVQGIVLRIDSPGGAVGPSQDIYNAVQDIKSRKPVVVSMGSLAASGGLYSALSASKIYCEPGTLTGSIGVIFQSPNFTKIADKVGFDMVTVKSGKLKDVGNPFREMTPEDRDFLQATIGKVYEDFLNAVVTSRKLDRNKVLEFADGRVIVGSEAKKLGLVDDFGNVYTAARAVYDILGQPLPAGQLPKLFYPDEDKLGILKKALESVTSVFASFSPLHPQAELRYIMQ